MANAEPICRLLIEAEPHDGAWNMAYDEVLLEAAATRGEAFLRVYRWSEPTLSLGYFQKSLPSDLPESLRLLPRVRRLSGGGAILHHHEWTYSCVVPRHHRLAQRTELLYEEAHQALIRVLACYGIDVHLRGNSLAERDAEFLCFLRGDPRDVILNGHKIVGSAQRRRRGAVLQHGSVLLKASELTAHVPGLFDLKSGLAEGAFFCVKEFCREFGSRLFENVPIETESPLDTAACAARIAASPQNTR